MFCNKCKPSAMEIEIFEQPSVLERLIYKYNNGGYDLPTHVNKIVLVASGSSYHCARFAADLLGNMAGIEARAIYSSEFSLKKVIPHDRSTLYIFISQSGETADTLAALRRVNKGFEDADGKYNLETLCITNQIDSSMWKECTYKIDCAAGVENSIAATKSLSAQLLCTLIIALNLAKIRGEKIDDYLESLSKLPDIIKEVLNQRQQIKKLAKEIAKKDYIVVTADGVGYSIAKETALKIKETSYKNVNAVYLGEFLHGHVAVFNNKKSALIYMSVTDLTDTIIKNLNKINNDYHPSIYVIGKNSDKLPKNTNIAVNCENEILQMFANLVTIQILALEIATCLKRNIDKPIGLSKVVK